MLPHPRIPLDVQLHQSSSYSTPISYTPSEFDIFEGIATVYSQSPC
ncbi:hypothetical protein JCM19232_495 [Vibrio ishigakensis]|uniref:Uncharacterized protein n=1 Tax=Vibrio ishigakensis TaxID=1481914 RepID=A0A0B8P6I0_9VIBR|nr:hypothetical protein JCM19232_495 [Vibrio ishigakensis]